MELMTACSNNNNNNCGNIVIRVSNGQIEGVVSQIKLTGLHKGCAVTFDNGPGYDIWFYSEDSCDLRKHYMKNLILIK